MTSNLISNFDERLDRVCKIGQHTACCRWLSRGRDGYLCAKLDPVWSADIARTFAAGQMSARGDNCPGLPVDDIAPRRIPMHEGHSQCPFCLGRHVGTQQQINNGGWKVRCVCTASGPERPSEEEAWQAWDQQHDQVR